MIRRVARPAHEHELLVADHGLAIGAPDTSWASPLLLGDSRMLLMLLLKALHVPGIMAL